MNPTPAVPERLSKDQNMWLGGVALANYQSASIVAGHVGGGRRRRRFPLGISGLLMALAATPAMAGSLPPGNGLVDGRMCVRPTTGDDKAGECGAVEIALLSGNQAVVRISDIVYRLQLNADQLDIVLMHGAMQIDGFSANYAWQGKTLRFSDPEKGVRYEIDFDPERKPKAKRGAR